MKIPIAATLALFAIAAPVLATPLDVNIVVNGDAEAGAGGNGSVILAAPGWTPTANPTVVLYTAGGGFPDATSPGPSPRGANFFSGGPNTSPTVFSQVINIADLVATPGLTYAFSGYIGGFASQNDHVDATATFRDHNGATLSTVTLPASLAADRGSVTGLLLRSASGAVPAGTESIVVALNFIRTEGSYNDGYADSISLVLHAPPSCVGDLNNDHVINTLDLAKLLSSFGNSVPPNTLGDLNGDGVVNTVDLAKLLSKFGTTCP